MIDFSADGDRLFHRDVTKRWPNGEVPYILRQFRL